MYFSVFRSSAKSNNRPYPLENAAVRSCPWVARVSVIEHVYSFWNGSLRNRGDCAFVNCILRLGSFAYGIRWLVKGGRNFLQRGAENFRYVSSQSGQGNELSMWTLSNERIRVSSRVLIYFCLTDTWCIYKSVYYF